MSKQKRDVKKSCQAAVKRNGKLMNEQVTKTIALAMANPDLAMLLALQDIACANATAWKEECDRITQEILDLEPPE